MFDFMLWITIVVSVVTIVMFWIFGFFQNVKESNNSKSLGLCENMDCIRCNTNSKVKKRASKIYRTSFNKKVYSRLENGIMLSHEDFVLFCDFLNKREFWNFEQLPKSYQSDLDIILQNIPTFQKEFMSIWVENDLSDEWSKFYFLNQGAVQNEEECPQSNNILNRCQNLMTDCLFGYQFFSILNPGSKIDPHTGPTNVRLRCHVSLQIPVANPKSLNMNVNGVKVTWKDDEVILFDDSFQHHVVYNSKGNSGVPRVVLLLDFWHPDLTEAERTCLQTCFSPANIN